MVSKYIRKNSQEEVCSLALCSKSRNMDYILITSMSMFCQMYHLGKPVLRFITTVYHKKKTSIFYEKGNFLVLVTVQLSKEWWWGGFYQPYYDTKDDFESSYDSAVRSSSFLYLVLSFLVYSVGVPARWRWKLADTYMKKWYQSMVNMVLVFDFGLRCRRPSLVFVELQRSFKS